MQASDLYVEALAVAVDDAPDYRPATALAERDDDVLLPLARATADLNGVPFGRLGMLADRTDGEDVSTRALRALAAPEGDEPLYLVRSGPVPDPYIVTLARLVHRLGWRGEEIGITHLDEAGGTAVFELLDWCIGPGGTATALIVDEAQFADLAEGSGSVRAVAMRVRRGGGAARVLDWGEGAPPAAERAAGHLFGGPGPCDGWIGLQAAAREGRIGDRECVLIHAEGASRAGWAALELVHTAGLRSADAPERERELTS